VFVGPSSEAPVLSLAGVACALSPDGDRVAVVRRGDVGLWRVRQADVVSFSTRPEYSDVCFDDQGARLAIGVHATGLVLLVDVKAGRVDATLQVSGGWPGSLVFTPGGGRLVLGVGSRVQVWDVGRAALEAEWAVPLGLDWVAALPDGRTILTGSNVGGNVRSWNLNGQQLREVAWEDGRLGALAVSPDGERFAVGVASRGERRALLWPTDVLLRRSESRS
jgi:WD40 repeat protein